MERNPTLEDVARHPRFAEWMSHSPELESREEPLGTTASMGLALAALGALGTCVLATLAGPIAILALPVLVIGLAMAGLSTLRRRPEEPLERLAARIVAVRSGIRAGDSAGSATARHLALLELAGGERREVELAPPAASGVAAGAVGLAYLRGGRLVEFRAVGA